MLLQNIHKQNPLIHCITNYVTVNDVANILLACGASPVMSDEIEEIEEMTSLANALLVNIGTLNSRTVKSMKIAIKKANELNIPVIFDPVGAGATSFRTQVSTEFLKEYKFTAIRANISEMMAIYGEKSHTRGVDSSNKDFMEMNQKINLAKNIAAKFDCVCIISGQEDIISDEERSYISSNGTDMLKSVTGTGCMLSAMVAAFIAANSSDITAAALNAVCTMGVSAQIAQNTLKILKQNGNMSFRLALIDTIYNLTDEELKKHALVKMN